MDKTPEELADEIIRRLREQGFDAFKGGYYDISNEVKKVIIEVLSEKGSD